MLDHSISAVLRERASLRPSETAFTFIDYERDWAGIAETLTWSQLHRRTCNVARELKACGATGDRAVVLAPQGLDYIVEFLGALQAGQIAVPLSAPLGGASDERVGSVLRDALPSAILTTSPIAGDVAECITLTPGERAPSVIEVDLLDPDSGQGPAAESDSGSDIAYLQYTSGSTRTPAGVVVSHRNLLANVEQGMSAYFGDHGRAAPPDTTVVSWLPFFSRHGLDVRNHHAAAGGIPQRAHQPDIVLAAPGPVDAVAGQQLSGVFGSTEHRFRIGGTKDIRRRPGRA
ncbi:hypothetical protein MSHO_30190 [Mycobacterium shottsii]|uniref:AMP-dependent synthetase/ligase domain-containing protein n=1 Tax=Mycobacterium shottsii TaxID=133549 RepID=A0A7I7LD75_9MYCO|nr:hypothetical protein MSHO_30190 [Mycobacterium shottsii]